MSHGCPLTSTGSASRLDFAALHVALDALPLHGIGLVALLVAFTPLINIVLLLAFGTLVAGILRAQVPSLATRYISELSAFHDALLPAIGFGLVFLLPDVLDILVAVTRRYGKAVVRGATALNDEAATAVRLTVFLAVILNLTLAIPFVRGFHSLYAVVALFLLSYRCFQGIVLANQAIGKIAASPAVGGRVRAYLTIIAFATMAALVQLAMRDDSAPLDKACLVRTFFLWNAVVATIRVFSKVIQKPAFITRDTASVATAVLDSLRLSKSKAKLHNHCIHNT